MIVQPKVGFQSLPVELIYEVQLYALSIALPYLSRFFFDIFRESPTSLRVQYLLALSTANVSRPVHVTDILSIALRYPICTPLVLDHLYSRLQKISSTTSINGWAVSPHDPESGSVLYRFDLPRRLFRSLGPRKDARDWGVTDEPFPFLRHILDKGNSFPMFYANSHQSYALTRAVHARHMPLVRLLLDSGASPACKGAMAVKVAIKQRNLTMVKILVERDEGDESWRVQKGKRRRLEDRVKVDQSMLRLAVRCDAKDIIDYLAWEKGVTPDMQTLRSLRL